MSVGRHTVLIWVNWCFLTWSPLGPLARLQEPGGPRGARGGGESRVAKASDGGGRSVGRSSRAPYARGELGTVFVPPGGWGRGRGV